MDKIQEAESRKDTDRIQAHLWRQMADLFRLKSVQRTHFRDHPGFHRGDPLHTPRALNFVFTKIPVVAGDRCGIYETTYVLLLTQGTFKCFGYSPLYVCEVCWMSVCRGIAG